MKIVLAGGTGFIGKAIVEKFVQEADSIALLTRNPSRDYAAWRNVRLLPWDAHTVGDWAAQVDGADVVMNFAGEPLDAKRWTTKQKDVIISSRVHVTRALVEALRQARNKPAVLINASGVGYYGPVEQDQVTEERGHGSDFLSRVVSEWEKEAAHAAQLGVRVVLLRMGVVLARDGGALKKMALPFKFFAGAPLGSGRQWFPWIHRDDIVNIVSFAVRNATLSGPVNAVAPDATTMKQFCQTLGKTLHRPVWPSVPGAVLKLALGEMADMLLTGQRVIPAKLVQHNYKFLFPKLDDALRNIFL